MTCWRSPNAKLPNTLRTGWEKLSSRLFRNRVGIRKSAVPRRRTAGRDGSKAVNDIGREHGGAGDEEKDKKTDL